MNDLWLFAGYAYVILSTLAYSIWRDSIMGRDLVIHLHSVHAEYLLLRVAAQGVKP